VVARESLDLTARQFLMSVVKFLVLSIGLSSASSDCIAFEASNLYERLEGGLLEKGLVLFGNNADLNMRYMAMPFPNVSLGSKDDYNFILRFVFKLSAHLDSLFQGGEFREVQFHAT
jgi:hypothetical protein